MVFQKNIFHFSKINFFRSKKKVEKIFESLYRCKIFWRTHFSHPWSDLTSLKCSFGSPLFTEIYADVTKIVWAISKTVTLIFGSSSQFPKTNTFFTDNILISNFFYHQSTYLKLLGKLENRTSSVFGRSKTRCDKNRNKNLRYSFASFLRSERFQIDSFRFG